MTRSQSSAYINSQAIAAQIEAMGMQAENDQRKAIGASMAYTEQDFIDLIDKYGIGHNSVVHVFSMSED